MSFYTLNLQHHNALPHCVMRGTPFSYPECLSTRIQHCLIREGLPTMRTKAKMQMFCPRFMSVLPIRGVVVILALGLGGCAMNETEKRTGSGAAIGALAGAVLGTSRESAAIGAAVGAAGGYIYDQHEKRSDADDENARLRAENERLRLEAENQRLREQAQQ
jgi:hypothetical protein